MRGVGTGILLGLIIALSACFPARGEGAPATGGPSAEETAVQETELQGDTTMRREFCTVAAIDEDCFVLKNTAGELYRVDLSFLGEFKEGDEVLLIYTERTTVEEGTFRAEVKSVYLDSSKLVYPAN